MRETSIPKLALIGLVYSLPLVIPLSCNLVMNNHNHRTPDQKTHSRSSGVYGHEIYTRFSDGSQEVGIHPGYPRSFESKLFEDLDGDDKVDRIRTTSNEFWMNQENILTRGSDYKSNSKDFDNGDRLLKRLAEEYSR
tara:strand:+ start:244 stop:654 length:411 start_codon:yes stop_codon:yes gene_type:complete